MRLNDRRAMMYALIMVVAPLLAVMAMILTRSEPRCTEDMPCWNCETMGNKICGPGVKP